MPGAVVFFVLAGLFMFFDDVVIVVFHGSRSGDSDLKMITHFEGVNVKIGNGVFRERRFGDQTFEVRGGFCIDRIAVEVDTRFHFDFGTRHAEEGKRIAFCEFRRFFAVDDVIGNRRDLRRLVLRRHHAVKSVENSHDRVYSSN